MTFNIKWNPKTEMPYVFKERLLRSIREGIGMHKIPELELQKAAGKFYKAMPEEYKDAVMHCHTNTDDLDALVQEADHIYRSKLKKELESGNEQGRYHQSYNSRDERRSRSQNRERTRERNFEYERKNNGYRRRSRSFERRGNSSERFRNRVRRSRERYGSRSNSRDRNRRDGTPMPLGLRERSQERDDRRSRDRDYRRSNSSDSRPSQSSSYSSSNGRNGSNDRNGRSRSNSGNRSVSRDRDIICFGCFKKGHRKNECPNTDVTCYGCQRKGHFKPQCADYQEFQRRNANRANYVINDVNYGYCDDYNYSRNNDFEDVPAKYTYTVDVMEEDFWKTCTLMTPEETEQYLLELKQATFWESKTPEEKAECFAAQPSKPKFILAPDGCPVANQHEELIEMPMKIEGFDFTVTLDTGAGVTLIPRRVIIQLIERMGNETLCGKLYKSDGIKLRGITNNIITTTQAALLVFDTGSTETMIPCVVDERVEDPTVTPIPIFVR